MSSTSMLGQQGFTERYVAPFLTGLSYLVVYPATQRIKEELYIDPRTKSENPPLQKPILSYTLGEITAAIAFPLITIFGLDDIVSQSDPRLLGATLGTILVGNTASFFYELWREE